MKYLTLLLNIKRKRKIKSSAYRIFRILFTCLFIALMSGGAMLLFVISFKFFLLKRVDDFWNIAFMYFKLAMWGGAVSGIGCCFIKEWK